MGGAKQVTLVAANGSAQQVSLDPATLAILGSSTGAYRAETYGADPTGVADSTAAFVAMLAAMPTKTVFTNPPTNTGTSATYPVGTIVLGVGTYKIGTSTDIGNIGPFVSIIGQGHNVTKLDYRGAGDCLRQFNGIKPASDTFDQLTAFAGVLDKFTIDGTNSSAGANGLHYGDMEGGVLGPDLWINNFAGVGSKGLYMDNSVSWTENTYGRVCFYNNTEGAYFNVTTGDTSFEYNDFTFKFYSFANQNGMTLNAGALYSNGSLKIRGNFFNGQSTNTGAVLVFGTSTGPNNSIRFCRLDIQVETNSGTSGFTHHHTTLNFTTAFYSITGNVGVMIFGNTFTASNYNIAFPLSFKGTISGDFVLSTSAYVGINPYSKWNLLGASGDPGMAASSGNAIATGLFAVAKIMVPENITITNLVTQLTALGGTMTTNQCFMALFSSAGAQLGITADQATAWGSGGTTGEKIIPMTAAVNVAGGPGVYVYVGAIANWTGSGPTFQRVGGLDPDFGLTGAGIPFGKITGTFTVMPSPFTPASLVSTFAYLFGIS